MFSQATTQIHNLERDITMANSRICNCENQIYSIKYETYNHSPIWDKIEDIECTLCRMKNQIEELICQIEALSANTNELLSTTRTDLAVKPEKPKQKIDLEILEQNSGYIDLDKITEEKGIWELYDENWYNR